MQMVLGKSGNNDNKCCDDGHIDLVNEVNQYDTEELKK